MHSFEDLFKICEPADGLVKCTVVVRSEVHFVTLWKCHTVKFRHLVSLHFLVNVLLQYVRYCVLNSVGCTGQCYGLDVSVFEPYLEVTFSATFQTVPRLHPESYKICTGAPFRE